MTGAVDGVVRIWKAPAVPVDTDAAAHSREHQVWHPSADRVLQITPDGTRLLVGDPAGHVHVIPADASLDDLKAIDEDVSFVGHNADVEALSVDGSGSLVASAASDNSIRIWNTDSGQPLPYMAEISGAAVTRMVFSPDASLLGVLADDRVWLMNVINGEPVADFELGESHAGIAFAKDDQLYVGGDSGSLRLINKDDEGSWTLSTLWQGAAPIRWLEASPRGDYLVLVDQNDLASQFILAEGRLADGVLQLPKAVSDVTFSGGGSRALFRTSRWVHRASSSMAGLVWQDSVFAPKAIYGAGIVAASPDATAAGANRLYLPAARKGFVEFVELGFRGSSNPGLFGNKNELLNEWRPRLRGIMVPPGT